MAVNYQRQMDKLLCGIEGANPTPKLFLHVCCAPCASYVLEYLSQYFEITVFFYNPNLFPQAEFRRRADELKRLIVEGFSGEERPGFHPVKYTEGRYEGGKFIALSKGLEQEPEGGERCRKCFELRLREAASLAKERGFDYFTTTLTISPLKNAATLNEVGVLVGEEMGIKYLPSDFKKKEGYKRSVQLSEQYSLYRQNYCGCVFSRAAALRSNGAFFSTPATTGTADS